MKNIFGVIAVTLMTPYAYAAVGPQLFFDYSFIFDQQCATQTQYKIDRRWQREANARVNEFQAEWNKEADALMQTLFDQTGKGFSRKEMTVTLSVCNMLSMSNPFLVNVRRWLVSFTNSPAPIHGLVDMTFHEFLHNFVVENLKRPSPLIEKYNAEEPSVRSHLHLMALQNLIYKTLQRQDMLDWNDYFYNRVGGAYARAWEIVTKVEGYQPFVDEIKK